MNAKAHRQQVTDAEIQNAIDGVVAKLHFRIAEKGAGTMASNHEILGTITEELREYEGAIHARLSELAKVEELKDIAVGAIFGIASIQSGGVDW